MNDIKQEFLYFLGTKYFTKFIKELRKISITTSNIFQKIGVNLSGNSRDKKYYNDYINIVYTIKNFDKEAITKIDNFIYDYENKYNVKF